MLNFRSLEIGISNIANLGLISNRNILIIAKEDLVEDPFNDPTLYEQLTDGQKRYYDMKKRIRKVSLCGPDPLFTDQQACVRGAE